MQIVGLIGFRLLVFLFWIMPFPVLYLLSDFTAFVLYRVIGYRKDVILENIDKSFPDWSASKKTKLVRDFYTHLADILLEGIKGYSMSKAQLNRRFKYLNPEVLQADYDQGKHVFLMPAHYGNWEWAVLTIPIPLSHQVLGVYKPLRAVLIEKFVGRRRSRFGLQLIPIKDTRSTMNNPPDFPAVYIMMSDQHPSSRNKAIWVNFLGRDTACLHGADHYARKFDYPVYYMYIRRVKRGYYEATFELIHASPRALGPSDLIQQYMGILEQEIKHKPSDWLWSHRRWKYTKD